MSAGGLSYHGIVGYGKATLPSIESWNTNMNILRDPPKSIMTRKIDKVGSTSDITSMIDDSGDRACEAINTYARGVNPFVKVSYDNYGNNGGQGISNTMNIPNARLPYALTESFRAPVVPPQNLLPLSRMNRVTTTAFTQPGFADFSKKAFCATDAEHTKGVKISKQMLTHSVKPTATYKLETPITENFEVTHVIQNPIHISTYSGIRSMDRSEQHVGVPTKEVRDSVQQFDVNINPSSNKYINNSEMDTTNYIQDPLHSNVTSNVSQNIQLTPIDEIMQPVINTKDPFNINYDTTVKGHEKIEYIHKPLEYKRTIPNHMSHTNKHVNVYVKPVESHQKQYKMNRPVTQGMTNRGTTQRQTYDTITNREYSLKPTISPGGFQGRASIPSQNRSKNVNNNHETLQQEINRKVMNMQQNRY